MNYRLRIAIYTLAVLALLVFIDIRHPSAKKKAVAAAAEIVQKDTPVIVIDPGHGGADGGCVSVDGVPEKGINLTVSLGMRDMLHLLGYEAVMTRDEDVSIHDSGIEGLAAQKRSDMENRLSIINGEGVLAAVSIHQNQFTDPKYSGAQMFYQAESSESERLAECIRKKITGNLQPENTRELKPVGDELYLIHNAVCPAVMVECGFLSNPEEAAKLESPVYQQQIAFCTAFGTLSFLNAGQ